MKRCLLLALLGVSALTPSAFGANEWKTFRGEFVIRQAPLSDPLPSSPPVAFFKIEGPAARAMFDGMRNAKTEKNACAEIGLTMKIADGLVCFKQKNQYSCNFGVGLSDGKTQLGFTC